ncbi:hypothetical protein ET495_13555 [Xylanimonas allomyrinae]|uniref:Uncharacterized protein n=1 Tax=Xylanimonas allomyrinae TaxID=2509459 RepID=A0A4P6ENR6_9MICO|nr:hypothetical protein [Xylanimonas allomyrinae]QAY64076.1 hypothetical protein ET495_13555 [Xylanimonas allomyrinae]
MSDEWVAQRTEAARVQAERLRARQDAVHRQAEALLSEFLPVVTAHGPAPQALRVRGYGGRGEARTRLRGWYLRMDRTAALGTDGRFYVLIAPLSAVDRLRGVHPAPARPPLVLGEGGKDGESVELPVALERVLPGWRGLA